MDRDQAVTIMARAICREVCAFMGEPPCFEIGEGLAPGCDDPGCQALAMAAYAAIAPMIDARVTELLEANTRLHNDKIALVCGRDAWKAEAEYLISHMPAMDLLDPAATDDDHAHLAAATAALEG